MQISTAPMMAVNPMIKREAVDGGAPTANPNATAAAAAMAEKKKTLAKAGAPKKERTRIRKRVNTAEKRASHNAVERQRRETLNSKFLDLARLLPTLAALRRPSKSAIVNASISHLGLSREQRLLAAKELRALFATAEELLTEVNDWRARNGLAPREIDGWTEGCEQVVGVERETFGAFLDCDGQEDGEEGDDGEQDQDGEMDNEASASASAYDAFAQANSSLEESVPSIPDMHRASFASFATSTMQHSPDLNMFVNPQSSGMAPFRSIPINSQSRLSFASNSGYADVNATFQQPQPRTQSQQHMAGLNAFLADSYDQTSLHSSHSQQSPLGGTGSLAGSNAEGGVVTPPPMPGNDARHHVNTFIDSPPPTVAPTSFQLGHNTGDKVSDWAAQQMLLQFGDATQNLDACSPFEQPAASYFQQMGQPKNGMNRQKQTALLPAAQRSLMVAQPQLAAAVFPPAGSSSPPFSTPGGEMYASPLVQPGSFDGQSPVQSQFVNAAAQAQAQIVQAAAGLGLNAEQLEHWKRYAMQSFLSAQANPQQAASNTSQQAPTLGELREAVRAGMTVGMGLAANQWPAGQQLAHDHLESFA